MGVGERGGVEMSEEKYRSGGEGGMQVEEGEKEEEEETNEREREKKKNYLSIQIERVCFMSQFVWSNNL